jgi:hypothetical protein
MMMATWRGTADDGGISRVELGNMGRRACGFGVEWLGAGASMLCEDALDDHQVGFLRREHLVDVRDVGDR